MRGSRMALAVMCLGALFGAPALAGDWVAVKLHGKVFEFVDSKWQPLERGDIVPDDRPIRTLRSGRVTFVKGDQTIDFGADTAAQIIDSASGQKTTVFEHYGEIAIEADVRTTEHFAVETKFLAAVVKGTKFIVTSDDTHSTVEVTRGRVKVDDTAHTSTVFVAVGEQATVTTDAPAEVVVSTAHHGILNPNKDLGVSATLTPHPEADTEHATTDTAAAASATPDAAAVAPNVSVADAHVSVAVSGAAVQQSDTPLAGIETPAPDLETPALDLETPGDTVQLTDDGNHDNGHDHHQHNNNHDNGDHGQNDHHGKGGKHN
jgi:hypothetical protein